MTWSYLPLTAEDRQEMLKTLGVTNPLDLYQDLPEAIRLKRDLKLPAPVSEPELAREFRRLAAANANTLDCRHNRACIRKRAYRRIITAVNKLADDGVHRSRHLVLI